MGGWEDENSGQQGLAEVVGGGVSVLSCSASYSALQQQAPPSQLAIGDNWATARALTQGRRTFLLWHESLYFPQIVFLLHMSAFSPVLKSFGLNSAIYFPLLAFCPLIGIQSV